MKSTKLKYLGILLGFTTLCLTGFYYYLDNPGKTTCRVIDHEYSDLKIRAIVDLDAPEKTSGHTKYYCSRDDSDKCFQDFWYKYPINGTFICWYYDSSETVLSSDPQQIYENLIWIFVGLTISCLVLNVYLELKSEKKVSDRHDNNNYDVPLLRVT